MLSHETSENSIFFIIDLKKKIQLNISEMNIILNFTKFKYPLTQVKYIFLEK